jgi:acyl-CoA synthetase (AMP-forming)/AMP-acid ligase II
LDFVSALRRTTQQHGKRKAVTFAGAHQSYDALWERACRLANALRLLGLMPGDRVATLADNTADSVEIVCGLALAGLVRCPMYVQNPADAHLYMLNAVEARALIVDEEYYLDLRGFLVDAPSLRHIVVQGQGATAAIGYHDLISNGSTDEPAVRISVEDPYIIRFSSGTTGRPKGILHSVRGWAAMGHAFQAALPPIEPTDSYLVAGPLSHAAGLVSWPMISSGARHVIMPRFDAGEFIDLAERERCTMTLLVPTMIQLIVNHPAVAHKDLSSLRAIFYGAAPISERTLTDALELWGPVLHQLYGQSEAPALTVLPASCHVTNGCEPNLRYLRSAGRPTPHTEIKILDDDDLELPAGQAGEICARTPGAMLKVWGDPVTTADRFTDDGYIRTRDVGYLDEQGFLYLADRKEDLIISGGFNVWPAEVENALCSHPAVMEAAVVGAPDDKWGETVVAVVLLRDGFHASPTDLIAWCRGKIGPVKKPTRVEFSDGPLPKNGFGKLLRRVVREKFWQGESRAIRGA